MSTLLISKLQKSIFFNPKNYIHSHPTWIHNFINNIIDRFDNFNLITNPKIPKFALLLSDECYDYITYIIKRKGSV